MNCEEFGQKLNELIDEELSGEDLQACLAHEKSCPSCHAEAEQHRLLRQAARATACQAPPELMPAVMEGLRRSRAERRKHWTGILASASAVALLMGGGYALLQRPPSIADDQLFVPAEDALVSTLPALPPNDTTPADLETEWEDFLREPGAIYPFVVQITCPAEKMEEVQQSLFAGIETIQMGGGHMVCRADLALLYRRVEQDPSLQCEQSIQPLPEATALDVLIMLVAEK